MAKQVKWTNQAKADRIKILDYFNKRNGSTRYSKKLNIIFKSEVASIATFPFIGRASNSKNVRVKVTGNYYIIYMIKEDEIYILRIWDTRQEVIKLRKTSL